MSSGLCQGAGFATAAAFTSLATSALLHGAAAPDSVSHSYLTVGLDQPIITGDEIFGDGSPTGLLLWAAQARAHGIDRVRTELIHPSLPYALPQVEASDRRRLAGCDAVLVAESRGVSQCLLIPGAEGHTQLIPCAQVPYVPLGAASTWEAVRKLRQIVMAGLRTVERLGDAAPADIRNESWRDWQSDLAPAGLVSDRSDERVKRAVVRLCRSQRAALSLLTSLRIHEALRPVLAPRTLTPPELGELLAELHPAAAAVVTAVTRDARELE